MCTPSEYLAILNSESYCPACGYSKPIEEDYCLDYASVEDTILIVAIPNYIVGYVV